MTCSRPQSAQSITVTEFKKAGVAALELKRLSPPSGHLLWLATPKLLRK